MTAKTERRTISISGNWRKDGPDREWAGTGTVDQHGAIECAACLTDGAYEEIEEQISNGDTEGSVTVHDADQDRDITYYWSIQD
jgi:hypothetical protein